MAEKRKILIADDSKFYMRNIIKLLMPLGYKLICVKTGDEAVEKIYKYNPDLIVLDIIMPGLTGIEVCRKIKSDPEKRLIPIILHTSLNSVDDRVKGLEAGADDFFIKPVEKPELMARIKSLMSLKIYTDELELAENVIASLAYSIEAKDPYTEGHCRRLSKMSFKIGEKLRLSEEDKKTLVKGGILHDIGKVSIPDHILLKPEKPTDKEWKIIRQHPITGYDICSNMKSLKEVSKIIRWHHEKLDGSGYPDGLKGKQIPITAQIMAVVDVYDALLTKRSYKDAFDPEKVFNILKKESIKGWWNKEIIDVLYGLYNEQ